MFTIIAALIQALEIPGELILDISGNVMQGLTIVLEYMIGCFIDLFIASVLGCMSFIQEEISAILGLIGTVFTELLDYLCTALHAITELVRGNPVECHRDVGLVTVDHIELFCRCNGLFDR